MFKTLIPIIMFLKNFFADFLPNSSIVLELKLLLFFINQKFCKVNLFRDLNSNYLLFNR